MPIMFALKLTLVIMLCLPVGYLGFVLVVSLHNQLARQVKKEKAQAANRRGKLKR